MIRALLWLGFVALLMPLHGGQEEQADEFLFPGLRERAEEIAPMLPAKPSINVPGLENREAWKVFGEKNPDILKDAELFLKQPVPELTDDMYLYYSRTGERSKEFKQALGLRIQRLGTFTAAEAITGQGRYLPALIREMSAILEERTWVDPYHDKNLDNFNGRIVDIDLGAGARADAIAGVLGLLGDRLPENVRDRARLRLEQRIFNPYLTKLEFKSSPLCSWITWPNNWTSVCHSRVVIAALWALQDRQRCAKIIAGAEAALPRYLSGGFYSDGFCAEGMDYWSYGFGHYVLLAEALWRQTQGKINLYTPSVVTKIAEYPAKLEMAPGQFPSIGDSRKNPQPKPWISAVCAARPLGGNPAVAEAASFPEIPLFLLQAFDMQPMESSGQKPQIDPLRGWFPDAQVLVCRMEGDSKYQLSAAFKGGRNGVNHGHSDLGEFIVSYKGFQIITDPGGEPYTATSFGPRRYESKILNSYGHAVPVVAGQLQNNGRERRVVTKIISADFSEARDRLVLDLSDAYDVPSLRKLERECTYSREGKGRVRVVDRVAFSDPQPFGIALITFGSVKKLPGNGILITDSNAGLKVTVAAGGKPLRISQEPLKSKGPIRIGIDLVEPVSSAEIVCEITAADEPQQVSGK